MSNKLASLILLITLGLIWGTGYSIARFAMTHGVTPLGYSFWQSIGPAILLSLIVLFYKKNTRAGRIQQTPYLYYFICGLTGIAIPNSVMYFAAPHLPAGLLAVVVNTVPIMSYVLALFARVEKFNVLRLAAIILAMCGLLLILLPGNALPTLNKIPWIIVVLITPLSFAFCAVYVARFRPKHSDSISLSAGTLMTSSIILFPFILFTESFYMLHWPLATPDLVILLEIILSSIGYVLFFQLIKIAGPVYYSLVDTTVALTGLTWGYFLFHEKLTPWITLGVIFILLALFLVTQQQRTVKKINLAA
ncbi:MAG: DMT family transporter [Gammaproteobacteria bacterium]|nr:DMT family transporter [Gammaproteobacteria bacterium]